MADRGPGRSGDSALGASRDSSLSIDHLLPGSPRIACAHRIDPAFAFTFIDLFAGIGGFRIALESLGGSCRFTSEWDKHSQQTYAHWFGETPAGDITAIDPNTIPDHDVLAAGFPCQPFSIAGVSKKRSLGQADGFRCERQGNLFFRICDIVRVKRPPVLLLENVKNLRSHDGGMTWKVIRSTLADELGYSINDQIIDAAHWVPQHRERIFITCFDQQVFGRGEPAWRPTPVPESRTLCLADILEDPPDPKYTLSAHLWRYLRNYAAKHKAKGNGFGYGLVDPSQVRSVTTRTLSARYHKDGSEILIGTSRSACPRRLTPLECARLMGFDSKVRSADDIVVSDTQAYRQFGNAVVPPVVRAVAANALRVVDGLRTHLHGGHAIKGVVSPGRSAPRKHSQLVKERRDGLEPRLVRTGE